MSQNKGVMRAMTVKWNFRNEPTPEYCETTVFFSPDSFWKLPIAHSNVEFFLRQIEH